MYMEQRGKIICAVKNAVSCTEVVRSHRHTQMSSSYSLSIGFCLIVPISLCLDSLCLWLCIFFMLHVVS